MISPHSLVGKTLVGRYLVEHVRSEASASVHVYEALDKRFGNRVSLRIQSINSLAASELESAYSSDPVASFREAMQKLQDLHHPTLVCVDDWGDLVIESEPYVFNVTAYFGQGSLREYLDRGRRLSPSQAIVVGIDICRALYHAHQHGLVHGDVRPANLIFGDDLRIRLTGLGTKKSAAAAEMSIEQARYAAPEIGLGEPHSEQTDIYSTAMTLFETITGQIPFAGETVAITLANRVDKILPVTAEMGLIASAIEQAARPVASERGTALELGKKFVLLAKKMPSPNPIETVVAKKFEDLITRPVPVVVVPTDVVPEIAPCDTKEIVETSVELSSQIRKFRWLWSVAAMVALIIGGGVVSQKLLKETNEVPMLVGLVELEARNQIATFNWEVLITAERSNEVELGRIIRSTPNQGELLSEGQQLVLVVSDGPTLGVLQDVVGLEKAEATSILVGQGMIVAVQKVADEVIPAESVVTWSVEDHPDLVAGNEVLQGTKVILSVSSGPALRAVPLIVGMSIEDATLEISKLGLNLVPSAESYSTEVAAGLIGAQSPPPAQLIPRDSSIVYSVSLGQDLVSLPNVVGINFNDAEKRLLEAGFVVGEVKGRKSFRMKSASINGAAVNNGDPAPRGSTVDMIFP